MSIPKNIQQREYDKFRTPSGRPAESAVAVTNPDGSNIATSATIESGATVTPLQAWPDPQDFIGLATVVQGTTPWEVSTSSLPTISAQVESLRAQTFTTVPITMYASGNATIFEPASGEVFYITSYLINSNTTNSVYFLSGASPIAGNASITMDLVPRGGAVANNGVDSPVLVGMASDDAFVINSAATGAISGYITYYTQ